MRPRPRSRSLEPLLVEILAIVAPCAACNGADDPTAMPETAPCVDPASPYSAFTPAPDVDGIELFSLMANEQGERQRLGSIGEPCRGAADQAACRARIVTLAKAHEQSSSTALEASAPDSTSRWRREATTSRSSPRRRRSDRSSPPSRAWRRPRAGRSSSRCAPCPAIARTRGRSRTGSSCKS